MKNKIPLIITTSCVLLSSCVLRDITPSEPENSASEITTTESIAPEKTEEETLVPAITETETTSVPEQSEKTTLKLMDNSEQFLDLGDTTSITIQSNRPDVLDLITLKISKPGVIEYTTERIDDNNLKYVITATGGGTVTVRGISEDQMYSTKGVTINVESPYGVVQTPQVSTPVLTTPESVEEIQPEDDTSSNIIFADSGTGDSIVRSVKISEPSRLRFRTSDTHHYAVKAYYGDGDHEYDLLVNDSGSSYDGKTYLLPNRTYDFEITCKGEWEIEIEPVGHSGYFLIESGSGDDVTDIVQPIGKYCKISYTGTDHFAVKQWYGTGEYDYELLVNESGETYEGTVRLSHSDKSCFFEVTGTDGFWMIYPTD